MEPLQSKKRVIPVAIVASMGLLGSKRIMTVKCGFTVATQCCTREKWWTCAHFDPFI